MKLKSLSALGDHITPATRGRKALNGLTLPTMTNGKKSKKN